MEGEEGGGEGLTEGVGCSHATMLGRRSFIVNPDE
jgi:hypothetical protein